MEGCTVHRWEHSPQGWRCMVCGLVLDAAAGDETPCALCGRAVETGYWDVCGTCAAAFSWAELYGRC